MVLASNCAGFAPERITRPYGEADGFLPIKNSGSKNTLSRPFCFTTFQFSQVLFFWGEKFCHKIRQNGSPSTCKVPKILTNLQVLEANGKGFLSARFPFQKWHCLLQPKAIDYLSKRNHTLCDINLKKVDISHLPLLNLGAFTSDWNYHSQDRRIIHTFQAVTIQGVGVAGGWVVNQTTEAWESSFSIRFPCF